MRPVLTDAGARRRLFGATALFVLGLTVVFLLHSWPLPAGGVRPVVPAAAAGSVPRRPP